MGREEEQSLFSSAGVHDDGVELITKLVRQSRVENGDALDPFREGNFKVKPAFVRPIFELATDPATRGGHTRGGLNHEALSQVGVRHPVEISRRGFFERNFLFLPRAQRRFKIIGKATSKIRDEGW